MASKIIAYCQDCEFQKENNFNHCPSSGKEVSTDDERSLTEQKYGFIKRVDKG